MDIELDIVTVRAPMRKLDMTWSILTPEECASPKYQEIFNQNRITHDFESSQPCQYCQMPIRKHEVGSGLNVYWCRQSTKVKGNDHYFNWYDLLWWRY